jgi:hypothetical protein
MEPSQSAPHVTLRLSDLQALAQISTLRLPLREAESRRAARVRAVLAAGSDLSRQLAAHTHCLLVNCQGSHGTGDLERETAELHAAAARYVALVGELVRDYGRLLDPPAPRLDVDASAGLLAHALLTEPTLASGSVMGTAFGAAFGAPAGASPGTRRRVS